MTQKLTFRLVKNTQKCHKHKTKDKSKNPRARGSSLYIREQLCQVSCKSDHK